MPGSGANLAGTVTHKYGTNSMQFAVNAGPRSKNLNTWYFCLTPVYASISTESYQEHIRLASTGTCVFEKTGIFGPAVTAAL